MASGIEEAIQVSGSISSSGCHGGMLCLFQTCKVDIRGQFKEMYRGVFLWLLQTHLLSFLVPSFVLLLLLDHGS